MFDKIIAFSLKNKLLVILGALALAIVGMYSATRIPLDAVPDITNNQVQIVSVAPSLAPQEVEQLITFPLEAVMTNIPDVTEVRSISRYGLSVITIVFEDDMEVMKARQYVQEQLNVASAGLSGITTPELMPITTGLGEIYQYVLTVDPAYAHLYDATELRTIQDWIVKRQLNGTKGVIEVSSFGGYMKEYEVSLNPELLRANEVTVSEVIRALKTNNDNSGGSYIEKGPLSYYIRTEGRLETMKDIGQVLVKNRGGSPVRVADVSDIRIGSAKRYGAMTMDGQGEVVGGITLMLKGANSSEVLANVKERMELVKNSLPEGVHIYPYLDRSKLISRTISTVEKNLIEGGLIVILVLLLLLGNLRAGLIVASVIPLSMLFALSMMSYFGISANLMSLGAIDFGIVIDGAVIIVEALLHSLGIHFIGKRLTQPEMDEAVRDSTSKIYRSAAFGVLIILVVFIPILTLEGIEGKTFRPMAQTVGFAILGSMLLSMTYVPVMAALFLKKHITGKVTFADRIMLNLRQMYSPVLEGALSRPRTIVAIALALFLGSIALFSTMGSEFVPTLEEGDIAMQQAIKPGSSLNESIHSSTMAERILLDNFPEVEHVVSKIGTAEVPTDPMAIEDADVMIILKEKDQWTSATTRTELMDKMKAALAPITWASYEFTQPIQLRFNELMTGAKSDISVKIFGEDVVALKQLADKAAAIIETVDGAGDVKVDRTDGLQQLSVSFDRERLAHYGVSVEEANEVVRSSFAGEAVGQIFEEERSFDLVVRLGTDFRQDLDLDRMFITSSIGELVPLSQMASLTNIEGPMLISREQARRFINIGINLRNRDVSSTVADISARLSEELELPSGYDIQYGGAFENLEHASARLMIAVPVALFLILLLLYLAFNSLKDALIIFVAVPLSAVGGILAIALRGMPFSISSGIGFIALFGVSVLNGIVLLNAIRQLKHVHFEDLKSLITMACISRLRPVLMTATVAALGFLPMALSTGSGAEVQRPLASVVIGGLISSTLLTLLVLPVLYYLFNRTSWNKGLSVLVVLIGLPALFNAQELSSLKEIEAYGIAHHPTIEHMKQERESMRLDQQVKVQWGSMDFQYQNGQINFDGNDQLIQVTQDVSPLIRFEQRARVKDFQEGRMELLDIEQQLGLHEWRNDLHRSFSDWQIALQETELQGRLLALYSELEPKMKRRFELGAVDLVEYSLFMNQLVLLQQKAGQRRLEEERAERELRLKAFLPDSIPLSAIEIKVFSDSLPEFDVSNSPHLSALDQRSLIAQQRMKMQKTMNRQWDLSAGYFSQTLEGKSTFQGFLLGLQVPFDTRINGVKEKQAMIEVQVLKMERSLLEKELDDRIFLLRAGLERSKSAIASYESVIRPGIQTLTKAILACYENGEIDFFQFSQLEDQLIKQELDYLDLIRQHNRNYLELDLLTIK